MKISDWKTFRSIDVMCEDRNKLFAAREFTFSEDDPCFYGREEKSIIEHLYKIFSYIRSECTDSTPAYCYKDCDFCYSDFLMILQHLEVISSLEVKGYSKRTKKIASTFHIDQINDNNTENFSHSVFVDEKDGRCRIYEVRPTICKFPVVYWFLNSDKEEKLKKEKIIKQLQASNERTIEIRLL